MGCVFLNFPDKIQDQYIKLHENAVLLLVVVVIIIIIVYL